MEKVQCDEPPIMKLGCIASLGPFRNTYLQENMVLFSRYVWTDEL